MHTFSTKGFTLIELLVVIAIIGLLAAVVLASLGSTHSKGRDAQRLSNLRGIQTAVEMYANDHLKYPAGTCFSVWDSEGHNTPPWGCGGSQFASLVSGGYISALSLDPTNKEGGTGNYLGDDAPTDQGYIYTSNGSSYILGTNLENAASRNHTPANKCGNYQLTNDPSYACPL